MTPFAPNPDPFPYVVDPKNPHFTSGSNINAGPQNGGHTPYVYEYNLTLEQQLGNNWATRIAYVGNSGHGFYVNHDINQPVYAAGASTTTAGLYARRPYEPTPSGYLFSVINLHDPIDDTHYNSLQMTLRGTVGRRSSLLASYVWSKTLDYGYGDAFVDGSDVRKQFGPADIDQRNTFVAAYIYQFPNTRVLGFIGKDVLSGWQANGISSLHTGSPFTVISGVDSNRNGVVNDRPDVIGTAQLPGSRSRQEKIAQYFNPKAFALPTGPYGNEQRNFMTSAGYVDTDLSLFKQFSLTERANLQFRAEAYNVFKNVNLGNPVAGLTSSKVGEIQTAGAPRILQFALKVLF